jgi:hypothetical protein
MIELTLNNGLCKGSIYGFNQYAAAICEQTKDLRYIKEACRIGKVAMMLLDRFGSTVDCEPKITLLYYGFVAPRTDPIQLCIENLQKGFKGECIEPRRSARSGA